MREAKTVYGYLIEDGIQQGIQQGLEQGRALALREAVYEVLEERFGGASRWFGPMWRPSRTWDGFRPCTVEHSKWTGPKTS